MRKTQGLVTLEIMIAMVILITTFSAVIVTIFQTQTISTETNVNTIVLTKNNEYIDRLVSISEIDFKKLVSTSSQEISDGELIESTASVETQPDFFTKKITATSIFKTDDQIYKSIITKLVTDKKWSNGGDTCNSDPSLDWKIPEIVNQIKNLATLSQDESGTYPITSLDAYKGKLFVTINNQNTNNKETLIILDVSDPKNPSLIKKIDNSPVSSGLNAIHATDKYAFTANGYGASFNTCSQSSTCAQLQIFDLNTYQKIYDLKIQTVMGTNGQAVGKSIYYQNGYVYLGLSKTLSGPEFNIIDVRNLPSTPPKWISGNFIDGTVNSIKVKDNFAYLTTTDTQELKIIDVTDKEHPTLVGWFNSKSGAGSGKGIYLVGEQLYLGKTYPNSGRDFHIINNFKHDMELPEIGGIDIGSSVNNIIIKDFLAFLLETNNNLEVLNISNPLSITSWTDSLNFGQGQSGVAMDCEGNYLFIGSNNAENKGQINIVSGKKYEK